jgi:hypothetical protein
VVRAGEVTPLDIFIPSTGPLNLTHESLLPGSVGQPYKDRAWLDGGTYPYVFSIAYGALPPGCTLDTANGTISGTPTTPGSYTFNVGVRDQQNGYSEREYTIEVTQPLAFTSTLPRATKTKADLQDVRVTGGATPYSISVTAGAWPTGLSMNAAGRISGTPTATGDFPLTLTVSDASGRTVSKDFTLSVDNPLSITGSLHTAISGVAFSQTLGLTGGYGPFSWSVYSGSLPDGLGLNVASGVLSGTAQSASVTPLVIMVEDAAGRLAFQGMTMSVTAPWPS